MLNLIVDYLASFVNSLNLIWNLENWNWPDYVQVMEKANQQSIFSIFYIHEHALISYYFVKMKCLDVWDEFQTLIF